MTQTIHPLASQHLPAFIVGPGDTDVLMVVMALILIGAVLAAGVFFFWLHSLPERMAHHRVQMDIVAVLCLLSLFTHIHAFWVAGLLLALIKFPDFSDFDVLSPLKTIASSVAKMSETSAVPPRPTSTSSESASTMEPIGSPHSPNSSKALDKPEQSHA